MNITLFILLFSLIFLALSGALLHLKKIQTYIFNALLVLLVVFDFSVLSLDKIYLLHQQQDALYEQRQINHSAQIIQQVNTLKQLTQIQLDMTLQVLTQSNPLESEVSIAQKIQWREQMLKQLKSIEFDEKTLVQVKFKVDSVVHAYLMEKLNQQLRATIGHRNYSEFVRSRPRKEWTDELFLKEAEVFLNKETLMTENIKRAISRVREFDQSGYLIQDLPTVK